MRCLALALLCLTMPALDDAEIDRRISALRTGDLVVTGLPSGAAASWRLVRHAFGFGTAVAHAPLGFPRTKPDGTVVPPSPAADVARYTAIVERHFSLLVAENEWKQYWSERPDGTPALDLAEAMWRWGDERGLRWRGHCGAWGVARWQPAWLRDLAKLPKDELERRMRARFAAIFGHFRGRVADWDVYNELMAEDIFGAALGIGPETWFAWAEEANPGGRWFVNEYKGLQDHTPEKIAAFARRLIAAGAPVRGIGDQAHYHRPVPDAATLWRHLDVLGALGLPVHITEFDLAYKGMDEAAQAEQVRRFYRVCFAHPAVEAVVMWGFWEGRHWRPQAALWRSDWTIKPAGQAYVDLMEREWTSAGSAAADAGGRLAFNGYFGTYDVTVAGRTVRVELTRAQPTAALP